MHDPAGQLEIRVGTAQGRAVVQVRTTRQATAARLFRGRDADAAVCLVPTVYSLCATAQAVACARAIEQARGVSPPAAIRQRRDRLIAAETVREHLWRIFLDWPQAIGAPPDESAMARAVGLYSGWRQALLTGLEPLLAASAGQSGPNRPADAGAQEVEAALTELVTERIFGTAPGDWLVGIQDRAALRRWSEQTETTTARLIGWLIRSGRAGLGRCPVPPLPRDIAAGLLPALDAGQWASFPGKPTWAGRTHETSPLTRNLARPLLTDLLDDCGNGLLSRLVAVLIEVARLLAPRQAVELPHVSARPPFEGAADGRTTGDGVGWAWVPAARGLLLHRVALDGDRIADYFILAPTDWNFHPQGVVASGLAAIIDQMGGPAASSDLARLFVIAVDPCVRFDIVTDVRAQPTQPNSLNTTAR